MFIFILAAWIKGQLVATVLLGESIAFFFFFFLVSELWLGKQQQLTNKQNKNFFFFFFAFSDDKGLFPESLAVFLSVAFTLLL